MDRGVGAAVRPLPEGDRKDLAIQALAGSETVSDLAAQHGVSRKFVYQQTHKGRSALEDAYPRSANPTPRVTRLRTTPLSALGQAGRGGREALLPQGSG